MYLLAGKENERLTRKDNRELTVEKWCGTLVALRNGKKAGLTAEDLAADDWVYVVTEEQVFKEIKMFKALDAILPKECFELFEGDFNKFSVPEEIIELKNEILDVFPESYIVEGSYGEPIGYGMGEIEYSAVEPEIEVLYTPGEIIRGMMYEEISYTSLMELVRKIVENKKNIETTKNKWAIEELEDILFSVPF